MTLRMLDTNTASYIIRGHPPPVRHHLVATPSDTVVVSVVTKAELLSGVARKGSPAGLTRLVGDFLRRVRVLPWDDDAAASYAALTASCAAQGITLAALDMMIAAHAVATDAILVTHDAVFARIPGGVLSVEDWASP